MTGLEPPLHTVFARREEDSSKDSANPQGHRGLAVDVDRPARMPCVGEDGETTHGRGCREGHRARGSRRNHARITLVASVQGHTLPAASSFNGGTGGCLRIGGDSLQRDVCGWNVLRGRRQPCARHGVDAPRAKTGAWPRLMAGSTGVVLTALTPAKRSKFSDGRVSMRNHGRTGRGLRAVCSRSVSTETGRS